MLNKLQITNEYFTSASVENDLYHGISHLDNLNLDNKNS